MARLIDTTLRLLGQDPIVDRVPAGRALEVAELLDLAGFHALEVSGGGCFRASVRRGVESPWERIRAYRGRVRNTPLAMALRGTFLVGPRRAEADLVRRFILCAAESGIEIFRLHDPLNDAEDLRVAAEAVRDAGARLYAGLVYANGSTGEAYLLEQARRLADLGADRVLLHDPAGLLEPAKVGELIERLRNAAGVPIGITAQGSGGQALTVAIEAARAGADPVAVAAYPVGIATHRPAAELLCRALDGAGIETGVDRDAVARASVLIDNGLGAAGLPPVSPHVSLLAALNGVNAAIIVGMEKRLDALGALDRRDDVLEELKRVRGEVGNPPLAAPVGQTLVQQAVEHVLSGRRWASMSDDLRRLALGEWGQTPAPIDPAVVEAARSLEADKTPAPGLERARSESGRLAASEEELCLAALFGDAATPLLERLRDRSAALAAPGARADEEDRIRGIISLLEESGMGEITVEEGATRITVRRQEERVVAAPVAVAAAPAAAAAPAPTGTVVTSPMVGSFYRRPAPDQVNFVEVGTRVEVGQILCLLEAMKLFNELKSDVAGVVTKVLAEDGDAVEFGQPLFEIDSSG